MQEKKKVKDNTNSQKVTNKDINEKEDVIDEQKANRKKETEISEEKLEKIKDELKDVKEKSKSKPRNKKLKKDIIRNILICVIVIVYFLFIGLGVKTIPVTEYIMDLKTFAIFTVIITVVIFEKAYKKDEDYLAIHGLEMMASRNRNIVIIKPIFIRK